MLVDVIGDDDDGGGDIDDDDDGDKSYEPMNQLSKV